MANIVVGIDGSASATNALAWALEEATLRHASVHVVCAYQSPTAILGMGEALGSTVTATVSTDDLNSYALATIESALASVTVPVGIEIVRDAQLGHPATVLIEAATGASMLVVGSKGHSELAGMLLGSVGMHCVHHASCPVVVIPHVKS